MHGGVVNDAHVPPVVRFIGDLHAPIMLLLGSFRTTLNVIGCGSLN